MRSLLTLLSRAASAAMIGLVRVYQIGISPWLGHSCRFQPSCSVYAIDAITRFGPLKGGLLATWRVLRCNPFGGSGYDPVPPSSKHPITEESLDDPHHPA
jgi:putative membrane protein insertion efficiency factor